MIFSVLLIIAACGRGSHSSISASNLFNRTTTASTAAAACSRRRCLTTWTYQNRRSFPKPTELRRNSKVNRTRLTITSLWSTRSILRHRRTRHSAAHRRVTTTRMEDLASRQHISVRPSSANRSQFDSPSPVTWPFRAWSSGVAAGCLVVSHSSWPVSDKSWYCCRANEPTFAHLKQNHCQDSKSLSVTINGPNTVTCSFSVFVGM